MLDVQIKDGTGTKRKAKVTEFGQLVVAPVSYDESKFNTLDAVDTAYNFFIPKNGSNFIITGLMVYADKDVNDATDTIVTVYEASAADSATVDKTLMQFGMGKLTTLSVTPLNLKVTSGKWVNAKTGDDDIHMTIFGYYV
jgi:hypothetical protein